ncbi:MAG: twin-arginine translocase subunit TatC [Planctomycetota bacterium]
MTNNTATMSFGDHLDELRRRIVLVLVAIVPLFVGAMFVSSGVLEFLLEPLRDALQRGGQPQSILATSPLEPFIAYLKVAFVLTLLVGTPWVLLQAWLFVAPGLYLRERRFVYFLIPLSTALTSLGMVFLYKVLLPISLYFLITFNAALIDRPTGEAEVPADAAIVTLPLLDGAPAPSAIEGGAVPPGSVYYNERTGQVQFVRPDGSVGTIPVRGEGLIAQEYRLGEYVGLVFTLAIVFALASQLPVVMLLLSWVGLLEVGFASRYRRHVGFGCAVAGAVLTPQDPISMVAMGAALYLLYEFGLLLMRFVTPRVVAGVGDDDA